MGKWLERELQLTYEGKIDSWAYPWTLSGLINGSMSVCPHGNLVSNIGLTGTHTEGKSSPTSLLDLPRQPMDVGAMVHPDAVRRDRHMERAVYQAVMRDLFPRGWIGEVDAMVYNVWKKVRGDKLVMK